MRIHRGDYLMATVTDELRYIKCPTCDTKVEEQNLARLGLTKEELAILKAHRNDETFGKFLQLVDLFMKRMDPEKLATESEMKRIMTQLQKTIESVDAKVSGTSIGKIGELVTVKELKSAFPHDDFIDEMAPFVEWKNKKGIPTEIVGLSNAGNNVNDIQALVAMPFDDERPP